MRRSLLPWRGDVCSRNQQTKETWKDGNHERESEQGRPRRDRVQRRGQDLQTPFNEGHVVVPTSDRRRLSCTLEKIWRLRCAARIQESLAWKRRSRGDRWIKDGLANIRSEAHHLVVSFRVCEQDSPEHVKHISCILPGRPIGPKIVTSAFRS